MFSAWAIFHIVAIVGFTLSASICDSIAFDTPLAAASASSDNCCRRRSRCRLLPNAGGSGIFLPVFIISYFL